MSVRPIRRFTRAWRASFRFGPAAALAAVVLGLLPASPSLAAAGDLSLAEAVRLAVARSSQLGSQRSMVEASREMSGPAGELPDPKLKLGFENVPTEGVDAWSLRNDSMTMSKIGLMQEFPREEKRQLRSERARRDAERGTAVLEVTALTVRRETATAWLARRYAADAERIVADQIAEAELAVTTAMAAYRAGKGMQADVIMAQTAVLELANRATEAALASKRRAHRARPLHRRRRRPPGRRGARRGAAALRSGAARRRGGAAGDPARPRAGVDRGDRGRHRPRARSSPTGAPRSRTRCAGPPTRTWCR